MSDLIQFRNHARFMAARSHAAGCPPVRERPTRAHSGVQKWCGTDTAHDEHTWTGVSPLSGRSVEWRCAGRCAGCMSDAERELWSALADEIDAYLNHDDTTAEDQELPL